MPLAVIPRGCATPPPMFRLLMRGQVLRQAGHNIAYSTWVYPTTISFATVFTPPSSNTRAHAMEKLLSRTSLKAPGARLHGAVGLGFMASNMLRQTVLLHLFSALRTLYLVSSKPAHRGYGCLTFALGLAAPAFVGRQSLHKRVKRSCLEEKNSTPARIRWHLRHFRTAL